MSQPETLTPVFIRVAATLVQDFDVVEFLHDLCGTVAETSGSTSVGVLLADPEDSDHLAFMAASDESAHMLELLQLANSDGPCLDAYSSGVMVIEPDLHRRKPRWPAFSTAAQQAGINSVVAFPLLLKDRIIGALNVFGQGEPMTEDVIAMIEGFAHFATVAIIQARKAEQADEVQDQLKYALSARVVTEQAKGILAASFNISVHQAFDRMREHARNHGLRLIDVAHLIVALPSLVADLDDLPVKKPPRRSP